MPLVTGPFTESRGRAMYPTKDDNEAGDDIPTGTVN